MEWRIGLELWSIGVLECWGNPPDSKSHYSNTPLLHHSSLSTPFPRNLDAPTGVVIQVS
jgi:hypothetical protein